MVAGLRAGNTRSTFAMAGVGPAVVHVGWSLHLVRYGDEYYFLLLLGGLAPASLEGGRPCSLGTFNYWVAGNLAFLLMQRQDTAQKKTKSMLYLQKNQWGFPEWAREKATQDYLGRSVQQDGY